MKKFTKSKNNLQDYYQQILHVFSILFLFETHAQI